MKRRFAIPAAIALTAHALLFLGLGKPPVEPASGLLPDIEETSDPIHEVELVATPPSVADDDSICGGEAIEPPKGVTEIPPVIFPGERDVMTQRYVKLPPGEGTKPVSVPDGVGIGGGGKGFGFKPVNCTMLDNPPRTRFQKAPVYPFSMKTSGTTGTVWVDFLVDEAGRVHDVRVVKSTHPDFEDATCAAVAMWKFEPGKRKGTPVSFRMSVPVVFALSE